MVNILFVHQVSDRSEASLVKWMSSIGDQVTVVCDPRETEKHAFEKAGAHVITLPIRNRLDLLALPKIRKLCKEKPIDLLYSSFNAGLSTSLLATLGLPTRVVAYRGTLGNLSRVDPSSYLTHLSPRLSGIVCNCPPIKEFLTSLGFPAEKIQSIFKGHDLNWYEVENAPSKRELGIPEEHLVVGLVANIRPLKGVEQLIDAVEPLLKQYPLTVLLVGSDKDDAMKKKVESMGLSDSIKLLGYREDAAQLATVFDIACLPSTRREGVPRSIVEAMSHGKPCVVTDVGGLPELVADQENGFVVPPLTVEPLREALERLLKDESLRRRFGEKSKERFLTLFKVSDYHESMRGFFGKMLEA